MDTYRTRGSARPARIGAAVLFAAIVAGSGRIAGASDEVGTVAAVSGTAEIGRAGGWEAASAGSAVQLGDELKTGQPGQLRVVFRDDTVLNLADGSNLKIDEQVFAPEQGLFRASMKLLRGKVRALVGEYYSRPGASYDVETATAVAGVRGTEFVVSYDPALEVTHVVGIEGRVEVRSSRERIAQSVFIRSGEMTQIDPGKAPEAARRLDELERQRYMEGLDFVSVGTRGLGTADPLVARQAVPEPDRAPAHQARSNQPKDPGHRRDVGDLLGQPAGVLQKAPGGARVNF